jgi:hypothetical protein
MQCGVEEYRIGEQNRQPPDLTGIAVRCELVLGFGVPFVEGQHPARQRSRGDPITAIDRRHRPIQQVIHQCTTFGRADTPSYPQ